MVLTVLIVDLLWLGGTLGMVVMVLDGGFCGEGQRCDCGESFDGVHCGGVGSMRGMMVMGLMG